MITQDQSAVVAFLGTPSAHGGAAVERIDTHASIVFVAGDRAWKLKRAVRYDYLDFSTLDRRRAMCEAEVRLNRRMAPDLYRGVVPVTRRSDGSLALGGDGTPVEWLVEMVRFDQDGLFDRLAARGALGLDLMPALAEAIARFHAGAAPRPDHGGAAGMAWVIEGNAAGFAEQGAGVLDAGACAALTTGALEAVDRQWPLLDARRDGGAVRQVHGDLHLRNIVLVGGRATLFDAIEFNDELACTDVLYDLAFLLMDLWRRQLPRHANAVWNGYLARTAELDGLPLLPLFLSCRAGVRAKTSVTAASLQDDPARRRELHDAARDYLTMAGALLHPPPACLVAIGGFSGSGKSTVARALAPALGAVPGAVVVRSDEVRKQLCGVDPLEHLDGAGYTAGVTRQVYATVADRSRTALAGGYAAIADAVYARVGDRESIQKVAAAAGVPFVGLWLDAPEAALLARAGRRNADASDADAAVIRRQLAEGSGPLGWIRIDAAGPAEHVVALAARVVEDRNRATRAGRHAAPGGRPVMTIESIMTSKPAACGLQSNLAEVAHVMWELDCGCLPIVDHANRVIGVVTDRDICIAASTKNRPPAQIRVEELPRNDVIVCRQDDTVLTALALMRDRRVRRLPVTAANGELVGIVSLNDIVLTAGDSAGIGPADVLDAMQGICSHGASHAVAAKAAGA